MNFIIWMFSVIVAGWLAGFLAQDSSLKFANRFHAYITLRIR